VKAATWLLTNDQAGQCVLVLLIAQRSTNQRTSMVDVHRQLEENGRDLVESGTDQRLPVQGSGRPGNSLLLCRDQIGGFGPSIFGREGADAEEALVNRRVQGR